jgi:uncharacterized protein
MFKTMSSIHTYISDTLQISLPSIENTIKLLDGGATIPFISRYRKEATGGLNEVQIAQISEMYDKMIELEKRKSFILKSIDEQGKLTDELKRKIDDCMEAVELEDIYLPYKPKRQTRAEIARKKGLEGLAKWLMSQPPVAVEQKAADFVGKEVADADEALKGACDIIAEWVNEDEKARQTVRNIFAREAVITSKVVKGKETEGEKYSDYFAFSAILSRCPSHRLLAIRRGEAEGFLRVSISPDDDKCIEKLLVRYVRNHSEAADYVKKAVIDGYKRLLKPSIETEFANLAKEKADDEAISVFADNLRQLLLAAPLGQKRILAIDPGYRTGCKVV